MTLIKIVVAKLNQRTVLDHEKRHFKAAKVQIFVELKKKQRSPPIVPTSLNELKTDQMMNLSEGMTCSVLISNRKIFVTLFISRVI